MDIKTTADIVYLSDGTRAQLLLTTVIDGIPLNGTVFMFGPKEIVENYMTGKITLLEAMTTCFASTFQGMSPSDFVLGPEKRG